MSKTFRVIRVETIEYVKDFTTEELEEMGFRPDQLEDAGAVEDVLQGFHDDPEEWAKVDAICEATEPHGDVQGQRYTVLDVTTDLERARQRWNVAHHEPTD